MLLYVWDSFAGTTPALAAQARQILVHYRIPHHALVREWFNAGVVLQLVAVLLSLYLTRRQRIVGVLMMPFLIAISLTLLQMATNNDALALLFPWRISTFLTPLSLAIILAFLISRLVSWRRFSSANGQRAIQAVSALLALSAVIVGFVRFTLDVQRKAQDEERMVEAYISVHQKPGEVYLIPTKMQDFRLASGAPAFVDFKSIPYRDTDVLEWYRRLQLADQFYKTLDCQLLERISAQEGVTHAILPASALLDCQIAAETYRDRFFALYRLQTSP